MATVEEIMNNLEKFKKLYAGKLLKALQIEADKSIKMNFIDQGRPGKWKKKVFDDGRAILTGKTGALLARTTSKIIPAEYKVIIGNTLKYGRIQNEGGRITVTNKMRKFFWAMYFANSKRAVNEKGKIVYEPTAKGIIWRNMALSRKGFIELPERRYLVIPSTDFSRIKNNLQRIINNIQL